MFHRRGGDMSNSICKPGEPASPAAAAACLPADIRAALQPAQIETLAELLKRRPSPHAIAYQVSLPWVGGRFYVALFVGRERRDLGRLHEDGQRKSWWHTTVSLSAVGMFLSTFLMCSLATAYLAKSLMGIDLFDGHFLLHPLFFD